MTCYVVPGTERIYKLKAVTWIINTDKPLKFLMNRNFMVFGIDFYDNLNLLTPLKRTFKNEWHEHYDGMNGF